MDPKDSVDWDDVAALIDEPVVMALPLALPNPKAGAAGAADAVDDNEPNILEEVFVVEEAPLPPNNPGPGAALALMLELEVNKNVLPPLTLEGAAVAVVAAGVAADPPNEKALDGAGLVADAEGVNPAPNDTVGAAGAVTVVVAGVEVVVAPNKKVDGAVVIAAAVAVAGLKANGLLTAGEAPGAIAAVTEVNPPPKRGVTEAAAGAVGALPASSAGLAVTLNPNAGVVVKDGATTPLAIAVSVEATGFTPPNKIGGGADSVFFEASLLPPPNENDKGVAGAAVVVAGVPNEKPEGLAAAAVSVVVDVTGVAVAVVVVVAVEVDAGVLESAANEKGLAGAGAEEEAIVRGVVATGAYFSPITVFVAVVISPVVDPPNLNPPAPLLPSPLDVVVKLKATTGG